MPLEKSNPAVGASEIAYSVVRENGFYHYGAEIS